MTVEVKKPAHRTVLCQESPRVTMVNPMPQGAKGLAVSRWATPAKATPPTKPVPTKTVSTKTVSTKTVSTKPVQPKPVQPKPVQPKPVQPKPASTKTAPTKTVPTSKTVLCQESSHVTMVNTFPPGAKGLATSRWA